MTELKVHTNQELFDRVVSFIKAQGKPASATDDVVCLYLTPEGHRCSAGCTFKDDPKTNEIARHLSGRVDPVRGQIGPTTAEALLDFVPADGQLVLLRQLQSAHDEAAHNAHDSPTLFMYGFLRFCRITAEDFKLDATLCTETPSPPSS